MLRPLSALLLLAAATLPATARPATYAMSCDQARAVVARAGGIVLSTSPTTYDRFVRDRRFCLGGQAVEPAWERTLDTPQCPIGYRCKEPERLHDDW